MSYGVVKTAKGCQLLLLMCGTFFRRMCSITVLGDYCTQQHKFLSLFDNSQKEQMIRALCQMVSQETSKVVGTMFVFGPY